MKTSHDRPHYAWAILLCCCALNGAGLGMIINARGLYISPVTSELNCTAAAFTLSITLYGIACALAARFTVPLFERFGMKKVLLTALTVLCISTALMGTYTQVWQWYLSGILQGLSGAFIIYIPSPLLINRWFVKRRGMALSISSMCSGIFGAITNQVIGKVILAYGWRTAYFIHAGMAFLLAFPILAFLVADFPQDKGLLPYGAEETGTVENKKRGSSSGLDFMDRPAIILCMLSGMFISFGSSFVQHLSNYGVSLGWGLSVGATMASLGMIGNMVFKFLLGTTSDRMGYRKAGLISIAAAVSAYVLMMIGSQNRGLAFTGAFLHGLTQATFNVIFPFVVSGIFSSNTFSRVYAICNIGTMLSNAAGATVYSAILDKTGSYRTGFMLDIILFTASFIMILLVCRRKDKLQNA